MMATTLSETEAAPEAWPIVTPYPHTERLDPYDAVIASEAVWRRIEAWITQRWSPRTVVYVIEGPGDWTARLAPFTATKTESWTGSAWAAASPPSSPLGGYSFTEVGPHRITGTAGDGTDVPWDAAEAWRRTHAYMLGNANARMDQLAWHRNDGDFGGEASRAYAAKTLQLSGAADLLRPYRRLA